MENGGRITLELPKLHAKLGNLLRAIPKNMMRPLVRIGPNQVSFYSIEVYKKVHSPKSGFVKDPRVYSQFVQDGHPALFSITNPKQHAERRRHMGIIFNRSKVPVLTEMMLEELSRFKGLLESLRPKGVIELLHTCRALEADIVSRFAFGNEIGAIESLKTGLLQSIVRDNDLKSSMMPIYTAFPRAITLWHYLEATIFQYTGWQTGFTASTKQFDIWATTQLESAFDAEKAHFSFLKAMAGTRMPSQSALSEAKEMLGPGTDTTSATLAHILYALSFNQPLQDSLVSDLAASKWPTDMTSLEAIPRLTACVKEGIRWTGAAAAMLPRIVPQGGALLAGTHVPGGTMISSSPIWYLRDDIAFPEPDRYRPGRWLDMETELSSSRDEYYVPFSKGPSTCVGVHFAYLELYLAVSQILQAYRIKPSGGSNTTQNLEAVLPLRKEWVAAVPIRGLDVVLEERLH
ncbi:hypothetical protein BBP40_009769 [Aspergillus hancockii]|nr:hypothetical protein BBP40_009769 [Aspergillus hancockii]